MTPALLISLADYLLVVLLVPRILLQKNEAGNTLAWLLLVVFLPFAGAAFWWILGPRRIRRRKRKARRIQEEAEAALKQSRPHPEDDLPVPEAGLGNGDWPFREDLLRLAERVERFPASRGNFATLLDDPSEAFDALLDALEKAESRILFESYIFRPDRTGRRILDLLAAKAREGVKVFLLADGVGSFELGSRATAELCRSGGRFAHFAPVRPISRPWSLHFRNHRKIVAIDGLRALVGSFNVGEEYFPEDGSPSRPWRNQLCDIRGPAARCLEEVCAEDWHFATGEDPLADLPKPVMRPREEDEIVQVVRSGPVDREEMTIHRLIFAAISSARERIRLTTPYFVPDEPILMALETAAGRGVTVDLLLPARSDVPLTLIAGRSHYPRLLEAGCRIHEFEGGILHSKSLVVDGKWATLGSANIDRRSFYLNFEANVIVYGSHFAGTLEDSFERDLRRSRRIDRPVYENALVQGVTRVLAPLL